MSIDNKMREALIAAGIKVTPKPEVINKTQQTVEMKINQAYRNIKAIREYSARCNSAPDSFEFMAALDGIKSRTNDVCQFIIDIAQIMYEKIDNKTLQDKFSLIRATTYIRSSFKLDNEQQDVINKLASRNNLEHDYVNVEAYKIDVADFFSVQHNIDALESILDLIKVQLKTNKLL